MLPLPKIHLVNQMLADRIKLATAQVLESWAAPLLVLGGQRLSGGDGKFDKRREERDQSNQELYEL